jgi:hypothetical protein
VKCGDARFTLESLPEFITELYESLWTTMVDSTMVYNKNRIVFGVTCGMDMKA